MFEIKFENINHSDEHISMCTEILVHIAYTPPDKSA